MVVVRLTVVGGMLVIAGCGVVLRGGGCQLLLDRHETDRDGERERQTRRG